MGLKIVCVCAAYHPGNPAQYCQRAFEKMGHEAKVVSQYEFYDIFKGNGADLYFCVDSGGPLNMFESSIADRSMDKVCFWMIDYRRGKHLKNPNDIDTCKLIGDRGGWVFQAQYEDVAACRQEATGRVSWLPLAADTEIWSHEPKEELIYDVGFVGSIWDGAREEALTSIRRAGFKLNAHAMGEVWNEAAAKVLRQSKVCFNISSFFNESVAFDINMRVFDSLACGRPLVTNWVPGLDKLFGNVPFIKTYRSFQEILPTLFVALSDQEFMNSGIFGRQWMEIKGSYQVRMEDALIELKKQNIV